MVITDLDGTLTCSNHKINEVDYNTLVELGKKNITRIIATGRSVFSALRVIEKDFPIDYLIFSNGAGVINWSDKKLLLAHNMRRNEIEQAREILIKNNVDFMIHDTVPDNHKFTYFGTGNDNPDFFKRIEIYKPYTSLLVPDKYIENACQLVAMIPESKPELFNYLTPKFGFLNVIKTTSPFNGKSLWMELFPPNVSKGSAVNWLANYINIPQKNSISVGNDFNDLTLLEWTSISYVVDNAPDEMKEKFLVTNSNLENGFSTAIQKHF